MNKRRTVTIKWDELEYVSKSKTVYEEDSDKEYSKIKMRYGIRNLRRI